MIWYVPSCHIYQCHTVGFEMCLLLISPFSQIFEITIWLATNPNPNISLVKPPCVFGRICSISLSHHITSYAIVFPVYPHVVQTLFPSGSYPHYSYVVAVNLVKSPISTLLFYLTCCIPTLSLGYPYVRRFKPVKLKLCYSLTSLSYLSYKPT